MIGQHSHDFRDLQRSVEKAHGDRERAIRNVCRLCRVRDPRPRILSAQTGALCLFKPTLQRAYYLLSKAEIPT
jgi:hypothetical protein